MINGIGFFEILVIGALVLMFFGSKELPRFIRDAGKLLGQVRRYSDKVRRELNEMTRMVDNAPSPGNDVAAKKKVLREQYITARKALTEEQRKEKSESIWNHLSSLPEWNKAKAIMVYMATESEVQTDACVKAALDCGKRVIVPYVRPYTDDLGIAAITDVEKDLEKGSLGIMEPIAAMRDNFFKSDLQLVICPGVAFDKRGARLGRGKACYDNFLKDLRGRTPIIGVAFECQIMNDFIPFDYHDIPVDQVITENGLVLKSTDVSEEQTTIEQSDKPLVVEPE